jgi:hypothetical protein
MAPAVKLKRQERRMLALMHDGGTIAVGLGAGMDLHRRGFVQIAKFGRWGITAEGKLAIEGYPADIAAFKGVG